jgi:multidrug transporter EmrE-like cation transporter
MSGKLTGFLLIICSTFLEAVGQMFLKNSASSSEIRFKKNVLLVVGVLCFVGEALVWSCVMRLLDVAIAYPMASFSFVAITIISLIFLKEKVTKERWLGVSFIICGAALLGWSECLK